MQRLICSVNLFALEQRIFINPTTTVSARTSNLAEELVRIARETKVMDVELYGNKQFLEKIVEDIAKIDSAVTVYIGERGKRNKCDLIN